MSEWLDLFVYASLIIAFWFVLPAWSARFTLAIGIHTGFATIRMWLRGCRETAACSGCTTHGAS